MRVNACTLCMSLFIQSQTLFMHAFTCATYTYIYDLDSSFPKISFMCSAITAIGVQIEVAFPYLHTVLKFTVSKKMFAISIV